MLFRQFVIGIILFQSIYSISFEERGIQEVHNLINGLICKQYYQYISVLKQQYTFPSKLFNIQSLLQNGLKYEAIFLLLSYLKIDHNFSKVISDTLRNKASGGLIVKRIDESVERFFMLLFSDISLLGNNVTLSCKDLFHGHVMFYEYDTYYDIIIVFHAKEYVSDKTDRSYLSRNYIWSLRNALLIQCNKNKTDCYKNLIMHSVALLPEFYQDVIEANTVQESYFGKHLFDINYFPEYVPYCFAL
ncbi:hypothetical protein K9K77_01290 [Candidatus Babeliales bacterium]|nr:hypothetical protein [Candidatus Babeliales bacterium]